MRRATRASTVGQPRGQNIDDLSIRDRRADLEDRAIPGHRVGNLITGSQHTHIAILVERQSRVTMLVKVTRKDTASVVTALSQRVRALPAALRLSLTWDCGMELTHHMPFTVDTKVPVYFCDLQSPWQGGTNDNTNRLLRQYFPNGTACHGTPTQTEQDRVAIESTPAEGVGISDTGGSCCKPRLNLPCLCSSGTIRTTHTAPLFHSSGIGAEEPEWPARSRPYLFFGMVSFRT